MAKKADLLEKAKELNLDVTEKNTVADIENAVANATKTNSNIEVEEPQEPP